MQNEIYREAEEPILYRIKREENTECGNVLNFILFQVRASRKTSSLPPAACCIRALQGKLILYKPLLHSSPQCSTLNSFNSGNTTRLPDQKCFRASLTISPPNVAPAPNIAALPNFTAMLLTHSWCCSLVSQIDSIFKPFENPILSTENNPHPINVKSQGFK